MAIPDFQSIMLPMLQLVSDGRDYPIREVIITLADYYQLTEEERLVLQKSGNQPVFANRVNWAATHLRKALLLETPRRGYVRITQRGLDVLANPPAKVNLKYLKQFPEAASFINGDKNQTIVLEEDSIPAIEKPPQEAIESSYEQLRQSLEEEILDRLMELSPAKFERLVVDVLVAMGYGTGQAIGRTGDGGIDGIINEDKLGLDVVYIQAKRWEGSVGRPEIQRFAGALQENRAKKGVFITTSDFTKDAKNYVERIESKIVLINGQQLAGFMIDYNVGVSIIKTYAIKRIDSDYYEE